MDNKNANSKAIKPTEASNLRTDVMDVGKRLLLILNNPDIIGKEQYCDISDLKYELRQLNGTIELFLKQIA